MSNEDKFKEAILKIRPFIQSCTDEELIWLKNSLEKEVKRLKEENAEMEKEIERLRKEQE